MPDVPGVPSAEELSALPHAELAARLAEAYRLIGRADGAGRAAVGRVEELERQAGQGFVDVVAAAVVGQPV